MNVIWLSVGAGIFAMGFGGFISALLFKRSSEKITCWLLSFAAGIMTSVVCFGLMPEAIELSGMTPSVLGLVLGIIVIMLLNRVVDKITEKKNGKMNLHETHEELYHQTSVILNPKKMLRSGIIMIIAIGLHNIPEGIAIGAGGSHDLGLGLLIAFMIALHNIPEGMAIAAPLLAGGVNRVKVVCMTLVCGFTTVFGAMLGTLIGNISDFAVALSLSAAGGAMLYVVFGEIIPQTVVMTKSRIAPLITLFGIILGLMMTAI
ncbi:MAG: ZIP family metal transporter [Defluviitaleaceae bacterium]|nr:ZIP family metal transporter [Defluviitaleaceae bacterium]